MSSETVLCLIFGLLMLWAALREGYIPQLRKILLYVLVLIILIVTVCIGLIKLNPWPWETTIRDVHTLLSSPVNRDLVNRLYQYNECAKTARDLTPVIAEFAGVGSEVLKLYPLPGEKVSSIQQSLDTMRQIDAQVERMNSQLPQIANSINDLKYASTVDNMKNLSTVSGNGAIILGEVQPNWPVIDSVLSLLEIFSDPLCAGNNSCQTNYSVLKTTCHQVGLQISSDKRTLIDIQERITKAKAFGGVSDRCQQAIELLSAWNISRVATLLLGVWVGLWIAPHLSKSIIGTANALWKSLNKPRPSNHTHSPVIHQRQLGEPSQLSHIPVQQVVKPDLPVMTRSITRKEVTGSLLLRQGQLKQQTIELFSHSKVIIGSNPKSDITLQDVKVSPFHAQICAARTCFWIEDLGSISGTFVNDEQINGTRKLVNGDRIKVGDVTIVYLAGS